MTTRSWGRRTIALAAAALTAALFTLVAPSPASADALRPLTVSLSCTTNGQFGLPYGYQITTGSGLYYPPARSDATVSGGTKTFYLLVPTTATILGVNTWCNGFNQAAVWYGYRYGIAPGTSTITASGRCDTNAGGYPGGSYVATYCTLNSISYG